MFAGSAYQYQCAISFWHCAQPAAKLESVGTGEHDVEEDEVEGVIGELIRERDSARGISLAPPVQGIGGQSETLDGLGQGVVELTCDAQAFALSGERLRTVAEQNLGNPAPDIVVAVRRRWDARDRRQPRRKPERCDRLGIGGGCGPELGIGRHRPPILDRDL